MLYDMLSQYNALGAVPFHMPGHMRNTAMLGDALPYGIDITEIDGFDNLHDPRGVLKDLSDLAARIYGAGRAFPLVNGATGGILAAVRSAAPTGGTVLMARNCHKSVYNAVRINRLKPYYLLPETDMTTGICGSVTPETVEKALQEAPEAKLVIVTSPTYEGVTSDLAAICGIAHRHGVPVLVDAAHGAHLGFSAAFPPNAADCGADIVITSLHKTLPALTQSALALLNTGRIDAGCFQDNLSVFETSSPSYVLLSSVDLCLRLLMEKGEQLFREYAENLAAFGARVGGLEKLRVLCYGADSLTDHQAFFGFDPGKLVICTGGGAISGPALTARLRSEYSMELEMAASGHALAMTSICTTQDAFTQLAEALLEIDKRLECRPGSTKDTPRLPIPVQALPPFEAEMLEGVAMPMEESAGMMSLEYVWAYPPGIPLLVPGEIIDDVTLQAIGGAVASGVSLHSTKGGLPSSIVCHK